jgi:hypothetical protein
MEVITCGLSKKGLSKEAIQLALKAKRKSTCTNYSNKWLVWYNYCKQKKIKPLKPSDKDLAEFLVFLYRSKGLKLATLKNYRSAIANTIKSSTGRSVDYISFSPIIKDVLEGVKNEYPTKTISPPQWDLFLVLKYLMLSPFEPIETCSMKNLTLKTVFLVAMACARRTSGIHAISGLDKDIEFTRDNKSMFLSFLPEFRAKNQIATTERQSFEIKALSDFVGCDEEDKFMCPVRSLKHYLKRTSPFRGFRRRLFISLNPGYEKDISKNTITRWLKSVILEAHKSVDKVTPLSRFQTHEIRRLSTSLGLEKGVSLSHIMQTAFWRSESTFSSFYLRDISTRRVDQTYGIKRVVATNSIINL